MSRMKWIFSFCAILLSSMLQQASAAFLMSQIGPDASFTNGQGIAASQRFEAGVTAFDVNSIDDFTLTQRANLSTFSGVFAGFNGFGSGNYANVQNWRVDIYSSAAAAGASLTGDVASLTFAPGAVTITPFGTNGAGALVTTDLTGTSLLPGTYWIGLTPRVDFGTNGQTGAVNSTFGGFPSNSNSLQANPGGGFGFGATGFKPPTATSVMTSKER